MLKRKSARDATTAAAFTVAFMADQNLIIKFAIDATSFAALYC
jgi:hypothetical protein